MRKHSQSVPDCEESKATKLEQDIRRGELWLIRIGVVSVIVNVIIASIYWGQLVQMRKSTTAAETAAKAATETLKEIQKGGTDTHELAVQAKNQADRTKDVAEDTLSQADATNRLASEAKRQADTAGAAMKANMESASQDRRPWVGVQLLQCNNCKTEADRSLVIGDLSAMVVNTGKTPAIDMIVSWTFESIKAGQPIPNYDLIEKEKAIQHQKAFAIPPNMPPDMAASIAKSNALLERRLAPSKEVLAPNAARPITIIVGFTQERKIGMPIEDQNVIYGLGKITYLRYFAHNPTHVSAIILKRRFLNVRRPSQQRWKLTVAAECGQTE